MHPENGMVPVDHADEEPIESNKLRNYCHYWSTSETLILVKLCAGYKGSIHRDRHNRGSPKMVTLLVKVSRVRDFYFFDRITDRQTIPKQTHLIPSTTVLGFRGVSREIGGTDVEKKN